MDEAERLRIARDERAARPPGPRPGAAGSPAMVVRAVSAAPQGKYFSGIPARVIGAEAEGAAGTVTDATTSKTVVYNLGPRDAASGDFVIARYEGNRWVIGTTGAGGGGRKGYGSIPDCFCTQIPDTLTMTSYDPSCNYRMFQSCTIKWGPVPASFATLGIGANAFLSTRTFEDPLTDDAEFYYYLVCYHNLFTLTRLYPVSPYGSPFRDGILYTWLLGGYGNTCDPFHLDNGIAFPGSDYTCLVTIDQA